MTLILSRLGRAGNVAATTAFLVWANQVILVAWGLASWSFQRRLDRTRRDDGIQLGGASPTSPPWSC